jgi:hypothetical protein
MRFHDRAIGAGCLGAALAIVAGISCQTASAQLPIEQLTNKPAITAKNRVYIPDIAIMHIADGKVHVIDGDTGTTRA